MRNTTKTPSSLPPCPVTGQPLAWSGQGRPPVYANSAARALNQALDDVRRLMDEVGSNPGFTGEARREMRRRIFEIMNIGHLRPERDQGATGGRRS